MTRTLRSSDHPDDPVVGRFAPSPTGPLHYGSLIAAVGSFLSARSRGGTWLVRMEDLDPPRELAGAAATILRQLEQLALTWDGEVMYQSDRADAYAAALRELEHDGLVFRCSCGRRALKAAAATGIDGPVYPGTCRDAARDPAVRHSLRFRIGAGVHRFDDRWRGPQQGDRESDLGDFNLRRSDGLTSYPLAVVVDDQAQGITEVIRGADLLPATHRQRILQDALGYPAPAYGHLPMILDATGDKLSKSEGAAAIDPNAPAAPLQRALVQLGQAPPPDAASTGPEALLDWATAHWDASAVPAEDLPLPT
jgi:glutamyl-Q tRNA(Asp) synthetase